MNSAEELNLIIAAWWRQRWSLLNEGRQMRQSPGPVAVIMGSNWRSWWSSWSGEEGWTQDTGSPTLSSAHLSQSQLPMVPLSHLAWSP